MKKYKIFFEIEERGKYKILKDNYGYICGVYKTYKRAKSARNSIRKTIIKEYERREKLGLKIPEPLTTK